MKKKTNVVHEVLTPFIACLAFGMLLAVTYQMWDENRNALLADKAGPVKMSCTELSNATGMRGKRVTINQVKAAPKYSLYQDKNGSSAAFLLQPNALDAKAGSFPVILQTRSVSTPDEAKALCDNVTFTGTMRTAMALDFTHGDKISECYPNIDLEQCHVVLFPSVTGSTDLPYVAAGMALLFGGGFLAFGFQLIRGIFSVFRNGATLAPDREDILEQTRHTPLEYSTTQSQNYQPISPTTSPIKVQHSELPSGLPFYWVFKIVKYTLTAIVVPMAFLGKAKLLPEWAYESFLWIFAVTVVLWLVNFFLLYRRVKNPGKNIRRLVRPDSLPKSVDRDLGKYQDQLRDLGFTCQGNFQTNDRYPDVSREYLSADGQSLVRLTRSRIVNLIVIYSILDSGQVIMTVDMEMPGMGHPYIHLLAGPRKDLAGTWSIHQQALAAMADVVISVAPEELHDFWKYTETLEEQMIGRRPFEKISIPYFRSLEQRFQQTEVLV